MKDSRVISFRAHRNILGWLDNASRYFRSKGELLELILTKEALSQASENGLKKFLSGIMDRHQRQFGDTAVIGVRLPVDVARLIEVCASKRDESVSEWCVFSLLDWYKEYSKFVNDNESHDIVTRGRYFREYATKLRDAVASLSAVYSRKTDNCVEMTRSRPGADKDRTGAL